ncbi:MAG: hypothetical protein P8J18_05440 [Halieaceae bacterium]|nr:hypothetical protein [Halieaceae bacterium]
MTLPNSRARYIRDHELVAYTTIFITLGYAFWFFIEDPVSVEYVRPGAPYYMWAGLGSLFFCFCRHGFLSCQPGHGYTKITLRLNSGIGYLQVLLL